MDRARSHIIPIPVEKSSSVVDRRLQRHGVGEGEVGGESLFFFLLFLLLFFLSPLSFPQDQLQDALEGGEGRGAGMRVHVRIREEREGRSTHPWGERELSVEKLGEGGRLIWGEMRHRLGWRSA